MVQAQLVAWVEKADHGHLMCINLYEADWILPRP